MTPALVAPPPATVQTYAKKVLIVCPWQKHCSPITAFCVAQLADKRRSAMMLNYGDAFVAHTRNHCADYFLKSDLEWMLTIDDDMFVPFGNAQWFRTYSGWDDYPDPFAGFNALDRLMSHGKSLVGAMYFGKHSLGKPVYAEGAAELAYAQKAPHDVCKPTKWIGTGCLLIHRSVYEDIEKKFPYLARNAEGTHGQWFTSSEHAAMDLVTRTHAMLAKGVMDGQKAMRAFDALENGLAEIKHKSSLGMGEDVSFCIRALEAGHQPHIDMGLVCGHIGSCVYGPKNTGGNEKIRTLR